MLWKLSLTGIKSRFRDYAVLFSGLTLASAIFYMFMTIAINPAFLKGALVIAFSITKVVFGFGIALLAIITLVYIVYANSFLLSMRKKDYGTYMMLGARNSKIGRLIFTETLVVGLLASVLGIVLGIGLTQLVSQLLISQMGLQIHKFLGFYVPAMLWTIVFFAALFLLAALWNRHKLVNTNLINLLHEDQKPVKLRSRKAWKAIEAVLGIALVAAGYWAMWNYKSLMTNSIIIGFFTIVSGSFFIFDSFFTGIVNLLRKNTSFKYKKLHSFTLGQLKFRLGDYTRILTVVSLLFALALGAITVGLNFNNLADNSLKSTYYDLIIYKKTPAVDKQLKKVSVKSEKDLNYKVGQKGKYVYFNKDEVANGRFKYQEFFLNNGQQDWRTKPITNTEYSRVQLADLTQFATSEAKIVSKQDYDKLGGKEYQSRLFMVNDFRKNFTKLEKLQNASIHSVIKGKDAGVSTDILANNTKTASYRFISTMASGFEFMGFFLGIAFLAMLASTLMFKVLSGAASDSPRYKMLWKMGTQTRLLKSSIRSEIGTLFALPAVLGIIDVLFGLQFFKSLLPDPYDKIWIPFTIFLVLYMVYYLITVRLYENIVLQKD